MTEETTPNSDMASNAKLKSTKSKKRKRILSDIQPGSTIDESPDAILQENSDKQKKNKKSKKKKTLEIEIAKEDEDEQQEDNEGKKEKKKKQKEDNGNMKEQFDKVWVPKSSVKELKAKKEAMIKEGLDLSVITKKMMKLKRIESRKLKTILKSKGDYDVEKMRKKRPTKNTFNYEENDIMTKYDNDWVLCKSRAFLDQMKLDRKKNVLNRRTDGNQSEDLTPEEQRRLDKVMNKKKLIEHQKLNRHLALLQPENLLQMSEEEFQEFKISALDCRYCGRRGHIKSSCPAYEKIKDLCFNCQETGHMSYKCPHPLVDKTDSLKSAKTFVKKKKSN